MKKYYRRRGKQKGKLSRFEYDGAGRLVKSINPRGQQTTWTYNTLGQLVQTQSPDAGIVRYKYDDAGLLRFRQQANQNSWGGQRVSFNQYDFAGRLVLQGEASADFTALDPNQVYSFEQDQNNWLGLVHYGQKPPTGSYPWSLFASGINSAPSNNVAGDNVGARAWKSNGAWQVETFSYDVERRPEQKRIFTQGMSSVDTFHEYEYDRQNNLVQRHTKVGSANYYHWYEYDKLGRLERIYSGNSSTKPSIPDVTYTYTMTGQVKTKQFRGNQPITYSYSIRDRMESQTMLHTFIAWNEYSPAGNITRSTFQQPFMAGSTLPYFRYDYNYDSHYRLTSANYAHGYYFPLSTTSAYRVDNLSYDAAGNILSLRRRNQNGNIVDNLSYSYQGSTNRLQLVMDAAGKSHGWQAGTTYYNYDASGNLTHAEEFDYQGTIWEYTRDTRNQVIRAAGWGWSSSVITDYRYNYAGHRYYKHVSGGSWEYFGLDDGVRTGLFGQATPGPIWNILTPSGSVIGRNPYNGGPSYYVTDHLGSTRVVVGSSGSIQEAYDYYPFGLPMPGRSITGWSETPERFTGYYKDQESYLYYAQARMYNPAIGRFLSVDPLASEMPGWNPYHYTFNNPVRFIDPDGLMPHLASTLNMFRQVGIQGSINLTVIGTPMAASASLSFTVTPDNFRADVTGGIGFGFSPIGVDGNFSGSIGLASESSSDSQISYTAWTGLAYGSVSTSTEAAELLFSQSGGGGTGISKLFQDASVQLGLGLGGKGSTLQRTQSYNLLDVSLTPKTVSLPTSSSGLNTPADRTATFINIEKRTFERITRNRTEND